MNFIWVLTRDKLRSVVLDQDMLRDQGRVVWGALVQANSVLFDPDNRQTLPANVIYSPDLWFDNNVPALRGLARGLFDLKGKNPADKELRSFARAITNELLRTMRLPLPRSLTDNREVYFTTCLVQPSHLPSGHLATGFFPLLICPDKTDAVMILPAEYWPEELCAAWSGEDG